MLIDLAAKAAPGIEVVFLDTQYHFAETLWYVERVREQYDLNLTVMTPLVPPDDLWQTDTDECCAMRKVEPLARALVGRQAWMSGVRRVESPSRTRTQIVHLDVGRGIVKVNPVAGWTDDDIATYKRDHDLLEHPLVAQGYPSIGCWPCTRPVAPGEDPRSGRWARDREDRMRPSRVASALSRSNSGQLLNSQAHATSDLAPRRARSRVGPPAP